MTDARPLLVGLGWLDAPGGLERYVADLRKELEDPPTIVISAARQVPEGVVVAAAPTARLLHRLRGVRAAAAGAAPAVDVVDLHFGLTGAAALSVRAVRRLPKVVHFHGPWADEAGHARALRRAIERTSHRGAQRFVVLSAAMGRVLIERYRADPWRVEVVPPGVDLHRFSPGDVAAARQLVDVPAEAFLVVVVRRLVPRTGVDVLLRAWADALPALPPGATLLVAGDGPQRAALAARASALGPSVRLLGAVDDATLVDLYRAADVSVVPSVSLEGYGLAALESLACGTPVVVTRCGGLPDAVAGLGVPVVMPGDAAALAAALVEVAQPGRRPTATRCRAHAEAHRWQDVAARHRSLYADAVAGRSPAGRRVVLIDHCGARSGGEIAMARLVAALRDTPAGLGTRCHAVLFEDGPFVSLLSASGATVEVRPLGSAGRVDRYTATRPLTLVLQGSRAALHAVRLAIRLRRLRPDVVHANSLKAGLVGGVAARLAGVPFVWHVRDLLVDTYLPARSARVVRTAARRLPVAVLAPSQAVMDSLGPAGRRSVERVVVADPLPAGPPRATAETTHPLHVLMVGRLSRWKGQDVFLSGFAAAFPRGQERATIIGAPIFGSADEAYAEELVAIAAKLGLTDRVTWLGERDDVDEWLRQADVVVHASRSAEPFGQAVVEGMAAGAAVIATEGGGPSELLRSGTDGLLVPPDDVDALAGALRRLAANPAERRRLGLAAQARASQLTDPAKVAATVAGVHERAARRRVRG